MNPEQPVPPTRPNAGKMWTTPRVALAALVLALVAVVASPGCNPTDSTANVSNAPPAPNATPAARRPAANTSPTPAAELSGEVLNAEMETLDGKSFKLADQAGKVVVMNLWATWCGPCRAEIPEFIRINDEYKARGVEFVGVTMEDDRGNTPEAVSDFVKEYKINYRIAWADEKTYSALLSPTYGIPQTYVLGRDGRVFKKFRGYNPQVGQWLRAALDEALADKKV